MHARLSMANQVSGAVESARLANQISGEVGEMQDRWQTADCGERRKMRYSGRSNSAI